MDLFCFKLSSKFNCTARECIIVLISVRNSKRQSYQCLQNKNPLSGCKVSTFFHFVSFSDDPFPAPTFYWCALATVLKCLKDLHDPGCGKMLDDTCSIHQVNQDGHSAFTDVPVRYTVGRLHKRSFMS